MDGAGGVGEVGWGRTGWAAAEPSCAASASEGAGRLVSFPVRAAVASAVYPLWCFFGPLDSLRER